MNNVQRSALVARPVGQLFDLIEAAEHYPLFLPWCDGARIIARDDEMVSADIRVRFHGISFEMRTRNPKRRPGFMAIHLERGPFKHFKGEWHLTPLGNAGCKVHFVLEWEFDSGLISKAAGPLFAHAAGTLVDAFVERAMSVPAIAEEPPPPPPETAPPPAAAETLPVPGAPVLHTAPEGPASDLPPVPTP